MDNATMNHEQQNEGHQFLQADEKTKAFVKGLAETIAKYEAETGNRVSLNTIVKFMNKDRRPRASFAYARDVKLTDELGVDAPRPFMVNALDVSPHLAVYRPDGDVGAIVRSQLEQMVDYEESSAGPFIIMDGHAEYRQEALQELEAMGGLDAVLGRLNEMLGGAHSHGDDCGCGHDHG